jgi:hypothetical protein
VAAYLYAKERIDRAAIEGATAIAPRDEGGARRVNRRLTRLRSDGALVEDVSPDGEASSEGSMPLSSYERAEMNNP